MEQVQLAQQIAHKAHNGQFRRDKITPYIVHPQLVASLVGSDTDAQSVAWLHDTIEDTYITGEILKKSGINDNIIEAVVLLTKTPNIEYTDYLTRIKQNPLAKKVKVADMLANLSDSPTALQVIKYTKGLQFLLI